MTNFIGNIYKSQFVKLLFFVFPYVSYATRQLKNKHFNPVLNILILVART